MNILSFRKPLHLVAALLLAGALAACGGGNDGGGSGGGGGNTDEKPTAEIVFPPAGSLTTADSLTVRGTASDDSGVTAVRVNGVAASSSNGFQTWTAQVPVSGKAPVLNVEVDDDNGNTTSDAASVELLRRATRIMYPRDVAVEAGGTLIVADSGNSAVFRVDPATGERTLISSHTKGSGPMIGHMSHMELSADETTAYIADFSQTALFSVNLSTGNRQLVSGDDRGTGPAFEDTIRGLAIDPATGSLYVLSTITVADFSIVHVDPANGNRTLLSSDAVGGGVMPYFPLSIAFDTVSDRLLMSDDNETVIAIDTTTGGRSSLKPTTGTLPNWADSIAFDEITNRAVVLDGSSHAFFTIDFGASESSPVGGASADTTPEAVLMGMAFGGGTLYSPLPAKRNVMTVNIDTGARTTLLDTSSDAVGSGPRIGNNASSFAVDEDSGQAWAIDRSTSKLIRFDLDTGNRTDLGSLPESYHEMIYAQAENRLFAANVGDIDAIDPATGNVDTLDSIDPLFACNGRNITDMAYLSATRQLLATCMNRSLVASLDATTWVYDEFSGPSVGSGTALAGPMGVAHDATRSRLLVEDGEQHELVSVDTTTRNRTQLGNLLSAQDNPLLDITDMMIGAQGNYLYLLDGRSSRIARTDLDTLASTVIAGPGAGSSGAYPFGSAFDVSANGQFAWVIAYDSLILVDLVGGDHVTISR